MGKQINRRKSQQPEKKTSCYCTRFQPLQYLVFQSTLLQSSRRIKILWCFSIFCLGLFRIGSYFSETNFVNRILLEIVEIGENRQNWKNFEIWEHFENFWKFGKLRKFGKIGKYEGKSGNFFFLSVVAVCSRLKIILTPLHPINPIN